MLCVGGLILFLLSLKLPLRNLGRQHCADLGELASVFSSPLGVLLPLDTGAYGVLDVDLDGSCRSAASPFWLPSASCSLGFRFLELSLKSSSRFFLLCFGEDCGKEAGGLSTKGVLLPAKTPRCTGVFPREGVFPSDGVKSAFKSRETIRLEA